MNPRRLVSYINLVAIATAFVILFYLPQYSSYAFYVLLLWILIGFGLMLSPRSRRAPSPSTTAPTGGPGGLSAGSALPSAGSSASSAPLDFCIYCGTTLPAGKTVCPACGHAAPLA